MSWPTAAPTTAPAASQADTATSWPVVMDIGPERRHLTVLFCDLVGSTEMARTLDPEDLRVVMQSYEAACAEAVEGYDGYVAQFYGDGVLAYFGYPVAHEDAAERAVHAAFDIIANVADVPTPTPLQVRVGIHSGLVVVGMEKSGVPGKSNSAVGDTPNVAARLQSLAKPGTVLVSDETHNLVADQFEFEDAGVHQLKGISEPVRVFEVTAERDTLSQVETADGSFRSLIGRERDLEAIMDRWKRARDGSGQVILVNGEAGIGKSHMIRAVREKLRDKPSRLMRHHCSPYLQTSVLHPVVDALSWILDFTRGETGEARLQKIRDWAARLDLDDDETINAIADLLKVPVPNRPEDDAQLTKEQTFAALISIVRHAAAQKPLLFVMESVQWADPTTLEFLGLLIEQAATMPVLVVISHRPEFRPPWPARSHVLPITLTRLNADETAKIVRQTAGDNKLPQSVIETIVDRADGVPMFAEELTKTMLGSDYLTKQDGEYLLSGTMPPVAVPVSLQDSLMARLDRLGPHKDVAQIAAMLGRTFRYDVLAAVSKLDDAALGQALAALVEEELLLQRGLASDATYAFRQGLIQEVAYQSLLISQRQSIHRDIAEVLETRFPEIAAAEPEEISRHYAAAGIKDRAVFFCRQAADLSVSRSAMNEALQHLDGALTLLNEMEQTPENRRQMAEVQLMRGAALSAARGFFASEVGDAFSEAKQLSSTEDADEGVLHARAWLGLFAHNVTRDQLDEAREISAKLLDLAHKLRREDILFSAYVSAGVSALDIGEVVLARDYLDNALERVGEIGSDQATWMAVQDPGVVAWSMLARTLFMLGCPEQAAEASRQAVTRAERGNHGLTVAFALSFSSSYHAIVRDWDAVERVSARAADLAAEHDFTQWKIFSAIYHGLALVKLGRTRDGLVEAERGIELGQQFWHNGPMTFFQVAIADLYLEAGQHERALDAVSQGIARMADYGGRSYEPELYRLRGAILRDQAMTSDDQEAELCRVEALKAIEKAIQVAKDQGTLSWHLRATMELVRLREDEGGGVEERKQLRAIYDRFTEGFDTPDLIEARAMLQTVAA